MASRKLEGNSDNTRKAEKHEVHIENKKYLNPVKVSGMEVRLPDKASKCTGHSVKLKLHIMNHFYSMSTSHEVSGIYSYNKLLIVYLKIQINWVFCILLYGNPP